MNKITDKRLSEMIDMQRHAVENFKLKYSPLPRLDTELLDVFLELKQRRVDDKFNKDMIFVMASMIGGCPFYIHEVEVRDCKNECKNSAIFRAECWCLYVKAEVEKAWEKEQDNE